jgi:hypothetical protein
MVRKGYTPEQIINKLREAEILLGQARATQRHHSSPPSDEERLTEEIIALATK